jgi:hypothetical protein
MGKPHGGRGAFQVASTVSLVRSLVQDELAAPIGYSEQELPFHYFQTRCCNWANSSCSTSASCSRFKE